MKAFFILLIALTAYRASTPDNSLDSLVFDFSSGFSTTMPDDGWLKITFNIIHYQEKSLHLEFHGKCLESGINLIHHPQIALLELKPGREQEITLFMNAECGKLDDIPTGEYARTIQFQFIEPHRRDTLTFSQEYLISMN